MASELEGLIAALLVLISCGGEQGCAVSDVVDAIHNPSGTSSGTQHDTPDQSVRDSWPQDEDPGFRHRTASTIWKWLAARRDVSIGPDRKHNHLSLDEVLALPPPSPSAVEEEDAASPGTTKANTAADHVRVYTSEETMWESLTGHAVDYKRVPRSEWLLLLGIASTTAHGILQGDLGRLVDQDKRSVPKRTDALLKKGYIAKRTTLVRGTKTSKMWLKLFAPPLPKDGDGLDEPRAEMNLSHQVLAANLDPVPWHIRWTGESVDYTALATTVMAISKEWGVLRMQDLKSKLGVLGMRWQMKVLAKVCRFLNSRGVIQYVAAKLGDKLFKDCIKYGRDLNAEDWSIYLATGKRATKPSRNPDLAAGEGTDGKTLFGQPTNALEVSSSPPWSLDKPLPVTIVEMAQRLGDAGLSNPDVYGLTLGPSFSRYLSSMTSALATPNLQPPYLSHFQLRSEHTRVGKIASYRYFVEEAVPSPIDKSNAIGGQTLPQKSGSNISTPSPGSYGFAPVATTLLTTKPAATYTDLCTLGLASRKPKGRPKKKLPVKPVDTPPPALQTGAQEPKKSNQVTDIHEESILRKERPVRLESTPDETSKTRESPESVKLVVTLKIVPGALKSLREQPVVETPSKARRATRATRATRKLKDVEIPSPSAPTDEIVVPETGAPVRKKRGRPSRGSQSTQPAEHVSAARPWTCEKCGGSWKNDIGLKYHLEKSRTACNPSYDESAQPTPRRGRKRALSETEDPVTAPPAIPETPKTNNTAMPDPGSEDQHKDLEREEPVPARPRIRKRTAAPTGLSSRPSISLPSSPFQAIPDWRRPSGFDIPDKVSIPNTDGGALVQSQDGQLRPVLGLSERPKPGSNTTKPIQKNNQPENNSTIEEVQPETSGSTDKPSNGLAAGQKPKGKPTPSTIDSLLPKVTLNSRISGIVKEILEEQAGVFPGGRGLWHAITTRWKEKFPKATVPTVKAYQAALRDMFKTKTAAEHCHAFRDSKGIFSRCQIIVLGTHDPFSTEATNLIESIKKAHPQIYLPPPFTAPHDPESVGESRRGRRKLGNEVETLNAPVYAAQVAAKRAMYEVDDDDDGLPSKRRRGKGADANSSPVNPRKKTTISWARADQQDYNLPLTWPDSSEHLLNQEPLERIQFLEPNTYLREETTKRPYKRRRVSKDDDANIDPRLVSAEWSVCMSFDKAIEVSGSSGVWPYISTLDFETQDGSYTLKGWMPDTTWFSWAEIVEEIEHRAIEYSGIKRQPRTSTGQHQRFTDRLFACMDVERSWAESFITTPPNATGPHNIFVMFFSGRASKITLPSEPLSWLAEYQLTPQSFLVPAQEDAILEDSTSSDDEDPFTWPTFRRPLLDLESSYVNKSQLNTRQGQMQLAKHKRVPLLTRSLTSLPSEAGKSQTDKDSAAANEPVEEPDKVLAAFVAIRVLLGGSDKAIDWGLLLKLFPTTRLTQLRRFWLSARKEQGAYVAKLTQDFQDKFLVAYEKSELPEINFDKPLECDWSTIIAWTLQLPRLDGVQLPSTRGLLGERFSSHDVVVGPEEDWREKFFHPQTSVFARFEAATAMPGAITVEKMQRGNDGTVTVSDLDVTRSWIRSLCCTDETRYSVQQIKDKFSTLANGDLHKNNMLLKQAIDDLTRQRIICRSKKPPLGGRPYRLNESYTYVLGKLAQQMKYQEAAAFKTKLDGVFRRGETMRVPYTLNDGSVMALTNLNAAQRIRLVPMDVPHIPFGFEPGNYESRKYPKSYYHFGIEAVPTAIYQYDEDIEVLKTSAEAGPPTEGPKGELPQWIDFFGKRDPERWMHVLGAFCFIYATRGFMTIEGICSALKPVLEEFEAQMIIDWGKATGVLKDSRDGLGTMVGEWWWLVVPWQSRRQAVSKS
ncbi:hypothetical protein AK830_g4937 [Neonectria ditissima]|uniref:Uncharacterized protein n=1 Tax=Neonectria ditissima TaxID=78410 RepID=A0A0P7BMD3_9HYPO|nr:hypothetical protein AK830_g4937 [Neonectria ditissima]